MTQEIGYALSCEEHRPNDLVALAARAEEVGFPFALISDHFHPWTDAQGQSPMVWPVLGAIAQATSRLIVGTGVTCPTIRIHPAIVAHAAATVGAMMPGRFFLGVGSGENLNEHVLGDRWPESDVRQDMLEEAVEVIRLLWQGGSRSHHGRYYTVENARLYTRPDEPPPVMVAAAGANAAELAARIGDGLIAVSPSGDVVDTFTKAGGSGPRYGQATVCWGENEEEAAKTAHHYWANAGVPGEVSQELPMPAHFEQASQLVTPDHLSEMLPIGPDPDRHIEGIRKYFDAGFDHVYVHQIGPDQEGFFRFYEQQVLPKL